MILYIFIDGIGFGENNPEINPFTKFAKSFFLPLGGKEVNKQSKYNDSIYLKTDASMGIKGLPQSATGQTSLWTGINAPSILNRHVSGFPSFTLKKIIKEYSIIKVFQDYGKQAVFLNCYSPLYLENLKKNTRYLSASTLVQMASGNPLKTLDDLQNGKGLFMDITHELFRDFAKTFLPEDHELLKLRDPYEMGKLAVRIARESDLSLYEYFLTDKVGHAMDWGQAEKIIHNVESFIDGILDELNPDSEQLIITSDHGNLENLSSKVHTQNPVPTFLYGNLTTNLQDKIQKLADIPIAIYEAVGIDLKPSYEKVED
ncbi:MAG: metalloenzyme [Leptospiraceae bacterium]|nr:metalloenzyme [Leptospiraceae bacterium]